MASRSRRKRRPGDARARSSTPDTEGAPVGDSRTGQLDTSNGAPATSPAPSQPAGAEDTLRRGYARGRARDEAIRQGLEPLGPGERPGAVTVAALVAFGLAVANVVAALTVELSEDSDGAAGFTIMTTLILLACAGGMYKAKYQAVLGFQVILGFQVVIYSLALTRVQKWWLGILLVVIIGLLGYLFWKLIRAMARLQMPEPPGRRPPGDAAR